MAQKIQLTPGELQSQATEMQTLESEYATLFAGVSTDLKNVNSSWSSNLANNFEGKINSAQKSFSQITQELMNGAKVANTCAVTFESVDSALSKVYDSASGVVGSGFTESKASSWDIVKDQLAQIPEEIKTVGSILDYLEGQYGELPEEVKKLFEKLCPNDLEEAYKHASDLLQGDFSMKNIYSVISYIGGGSTKASAIIESIRYALDKGAEINAQMQEDIMNQLAQGDVGGAVFDAFEGFVDGVLGGVIDVGSDLIGGTVDGVVNKIPFLGDFIADTTGKSAGDWISGAGEAIADGLNTATDYISDAVNVVTDAATSGLKKVGSWIGNWFN